MPTTSRNFRAMFTLMTTLTTCATALALEENPASKSPDEITPAVEKQIAAVRELLSTGKKSVTDILTDPQYDNLRPLTKFREAIRDHAKPGPVTLVTKDEPGDPLHVTAVVKDPSGKPISNVRIYLYHTDHRGWYGADRPHFLVHSGDFKHARLFAYLRTDKDGKFEFRTIRPAGYPDSDLPQHIHFHIQADGFQGTVSEFLFDDDPRLTAPNRKEAENERVIITNPKKDESGVQNVQSEIVLNKK